MEKDDIRKKISLSFQDSTTNIVKVKEKIERGKELQ